LCVKLYIKIFLMSRCNGECLKKKIKFFKIRFMRRRISVKRVDIKELYERLFKKLDIVYEKIKKKKRGRAKKYKESLRY